MHSLSVSNVVYQGGLSVAECVHVARWMGGVGGLSVYITQYSGRSACLPIMTVSFWCPGLSLKDVTTLLDVVSTRSLPLMFVCPLIFCIIVGIPRFIRYWSHVTMTAMSGLRWW